MEDKNMNFLNIAPLFGGGQGNPGSLIITIVMLVGFGLFFYFFMIRPQKKQEKEINDMRNNLSVGDEITTIGGIIGKIVSIKDDTITFETGEDRVRMQVAKWAISTTGKDTNQK